jgi:hypothetical protein
VVVHKRMQVFDSHNFFGIPTSQMEIKRFFSTTRLLSALWRCCLQIEHLDGLIFVNKNWPFYSCIGCLEPIDFANVCEVESILINKLDAKFKDEVKRKEFPNVLNTICEGF